MDVECTLVDFDLSADQLALADAAASLLDKYASMTRIRARVGPGVVVGTLPGAGSTNADKTSSSVGDIAEGFDEELWAAMAEQGWLAVERPESDGGLAMGMVEVAVLCEALGSRLAPAPFAGTILAIDALRGDGDHAPGDQLDEWTQSLVSGERIGSVFVDLARSSRLRVERREAQTTLNGTVGPALFAPSAGILVIVHDGEVFAVERDPSPDGSHRIKSSAEPIMDRTRELGWIELDAARAVVVAGREGAERIVNRAATLASAEMLGCANAALSMAVQYAKDRVQFGRPIGSFQAIKHKLADSLVDVEGMRSSAYYAAWCASVDDAESSLAASIAKAWCSDASRRVMANALQVHGGIGFTWEHDMHLFLKRAQLDQVSYGDADWHRDRLAGILRSRVETTGNVI